MRLALEMLYANKIPLRDYITLISFRPFPYVDNDDNFLKLFPVLILG